MTLGTDHLTAHHLKALPHHCIPMLIKLLIRILALPVTIVWRILQMIVPEATKLVDGPVNALKEIFRLR